MKILSLTVATSILLAIGFLSTPLTTIPSVLSQEDSVSIVPGAADPDKGLSFDPSQISTSAESTIFWTNDDAIEHTVTSDEGLFDSGPISPGDTFDNTFDSTGEFGYHCSIHPFMTGVVIVN